MNLPDVLDVLDVAAELLAAVAVLAFLNHRFTKLPPAIAMLVAGLAGGVVVTAGLDLWPEGRAADHLMQLMASFDFSSLLMEGMLGYLLFAGALVLDFRGLGRRLPTVLPLATAGVLISTALVGSGAYLLFGLAGVGVPYAYCLVFGALISPTDPIAVHALMAHVRVPRAVEIYFTGESLLNDSVGIVVFTALLALAAAPGSLSLAGVGLLFAREVVGGALLGLGGAVVVCWAARRIDEPNLAVQLSVALVTGLIALAPRLHASGPLACLVAGIYIGGWVRREAMQEATVAALDRVWSFADYLMNAALFLLLGVQAAAFHVASAAHAALVGAVIVLAVGARFVSVALPLLLMRRGGGGRPRGMARLLTWGGLRGGISVALALSLPQFGGRDTVLNATYAVVVFTIVVQGLTVGRLIRRLDPAAAGDGAGD